MELSELPKAGGRFDLPIALGILAASGQVPKDRLAGYESRSPGRMG
jgi:magnesium chelatase family protein